MDPRFKTFLLLLALTALVLWIGSLFGFAGLVVALCVVLAMNLISYFLCDKIVLSMYRAQPASHRDYPKLHKAVEELAERAKIPKPKLYIIPSKIQNAFATGRNPERAVVAVTHGLLENLNYEELKGVLAHELSHVRHRDILLMTIVATIAGAIMWIGMMLRYVALFSAGSGEDRGNVIGLILLSILAPLAALLVQLAISRSREFYADESGAMLMGTGEPLASALLKLERGPKLQSGVEAHAHLFIVNPLSKQGFAALFSTHPPIQERVRRLRALNF